LLATDNEEDFEKSKGYVIALYKNSSTIYLRGVEKLNEYSRNAE
jgi:hypothetical protein